ncbi:hypothetical protein FOL47_006750 [Perkinsus chesapeaki]|uniref:Uncharacterized protein n=1 Tax=Perkinsus chesapeaki TaxID=330153 RepID=A0A7J6LR02_PERCH|nr:hypothetical protein FOL47_006750 [Perkinsus chesapeaki]
MKQNVSYFILAVIAIALLSQDLTYRQYEEGDTMIEESGMFVVNCQWHESSCIVAVNQTEDPKMVLGFLAYKIPYQLTKANEDAVRALMKDPKESGIFGFIQYVEVARGHRRKHIGKHLVKVIIKRVRTTENFLALCLQAVPNDTPAVKLYTSLGFVKVTGKLENYRNRSGTNSDTSSSLAVAYMPLSNVAVGLKKIAARIDVKSIEVTKDDYSPRFPRIRRLANSIQFEIVMGILIILNCLAIAWQSAYYPSQPGPSIDIFFFVAEQAFTLVFFIEWTLRLLANTWIWLLYPVNMMDTLIVLSGIAVSWVLTPLDLESDWIRQLQVLRAFRLVRIGRAVRLVPEFREMWMMVRGLLESGLTLFWTYTVIAAVCYVFGMATTYFIGRREDNLSDDSIQSLFGDVPSSMFTLFQIMTLDSWTAAVRPLMINQASIEWLFLSFISISYFVLMNLITAVIVENAFSIAKEDEEQLAIEAERKKTKEVSELGELFADLDTDGSGELSRGEFEEALRNPRVLRKLALLDVDADELDEVWHMLDNGDGSLTLSEFITGVRKMRGEAQSKDVLLCSNQLRRLETKVDRILAAIDGLGDFIHQLTEEDIPAVTQRLRLLLRVTARASRTLEYSAESLSKLEASVSGAGPPPRETRRKESKFRFGVAIPNKHLIIYRNRTFRFMCLSLVITVWWFVIIVADAKLEVTEPSPSPGTSVECVVSAGENGKASFHWNYYHTFWEGKEQLTEEESSRQKRQLKNGAVYLTDLECSGGIAVPQTPSDVTSSRRRRRATASGQREDPALRSVREKVYQKTPRVEEVLTTYLVENTRFKFCEIGVKTTAKNAGKNASNKDFVKWICGLLNDKIRKSSAEPSETSGEKKRHCGPLCRREKME